jgi:hypothetical protein
MDFYFHALVYPHDLHWNFFRVLISLCLFLLFCLHYFCYILFFFVFLPLYSAFLRSSAFFLVCRLYTLIFTVYIPIHVAMLFINMLLSPDHSCLGHNIMYHGRQTPTFRRSLLSVFRLETYRSTTSTGVKPCTLLDRHQYLRLTYCFRLLH